MEIEIRKDFFFLILNFLPPSTQILKPIVRFFRLYTIDWLMSPPTSKLTTNTTLSLSFRVTTPL